MDVWGWSSIITEYLVDVEELCNRSPAVNYFQLVKVLVLVLAVPDNYSVRPLSPVLITQLHRTNNNKSAAGKLNYQGLHLWKLYSGSLICFTQSPLSTFTFQTNPRLTLMTRSPTSTTLQAPQDLQPWPL